MIRRHIVVLAATLSGVAFAAVPVRDANGSTEERISRLERMVESRNQVQLGMQQQLSELELEVQNLRGTLELHSHKLEEILARQRDLYQDIDRRLGSGAGAVPAATSPAVPASAASNVSSADVTANVAYENAFKLLKNKKYDDASVAFSKFVADYPTSSYVANAHYWTGQLSYRDGDLANAKTSFASVVSKYPQSSKRAESIFKLGLIAEKEGQAEEAKSYFKRVVAEYPSASVAQMAKAKL
ncbi:tol-pal system protein YbgF [Echinimonas agarilytica]|uniref:Cell division coordinator CpoB n=1 Tax=Echinimonas agarilytica TaxID=1215918 RepID=A0AA41W6T0_9GAMM|nr:tol-pal system protein YbgF [Echinimonas agarilytica]MCM2679701.1 tol-pal system protein YbgF [Echinimonas agarilytica]